MPAFLDDLLIRVADFAGTVPQAFRQVGVSEYRAGAGIGEKCLVGHSWQVNFRATTGTIVAVGYG
jgi:hypothetical protein